LAHAQCEILPLNVAGRNVRRDAAYYVALYCYYLSGAAAARSVFYGEVRYAVGLYDHAMVGLAGKGAADAFLVRVEAIR
jgi:hypothetical protein